jgi:serine/threonine-protein kinase
MLARDAAIKLIKPEMLLNSSKNADLMRRRFEQEAKTTASLRSPHTVQLYDFGVSEQGAFYYVMELLDGIDLESLVKRFGPLPPARVIYILRQVCRSLAEAHQLGMIHRDMKPSNIFLCRLGSEYDFAKVLDFGLVKVSDDRDETQLTMPGTTTGTPSYIAPELALGNPDIDGRTDLYGLGCIGYWLLTGRLVFEEAGGTAQMLAHLNKLPAPPSEKATSAVPKSLDQAILMCLAKNPDQRPASAEILAGLLDVCGDAGMWTRQEAQRWWLANMTGERKFADTEATLRSAESEARPTV